MKIVDIMTSEVVTGSAKQTVAEAAAMMLEKDISVLPVVDDSKKLIGIVTESDFIGKEANIPRALASVKQLFGENFYFNGVEEIYKKAKEKTLDEVMTKKIFTIKSDSSLTELINFMIDKNLKRVPVVDKDVLVGIVTRRNVLKAFAKM